MQHINNTQLNKIKSRKPGANADTNTQLAHERRVANYLSCVRKQINHFLAKTPRKENFNWVPGGTR